MRQAERRRETRERDSEAAREAILRAARDVFAAHGFSGARVDDIAEAAGYNKALIFHYFSDKLGLYQTLVSRMKNDIIGRAAALLAQYEEDGDLATNVNRCAELFISCSRWIFDYYVSHPEFHRMMLWEAAEGWRTFTGCVTKIAHPHWPQGIVRVIREAQAAGTIRSDVPPELPLMMCMSVPLIFLGSTHRFETIFGEQDYTTPEGLARAREQLASLLVHGILTPKSLAIYAATTGEQGEGEYANGI